MNLRELFVADKVVHFTERYLDAVDTFVRAVDRLSRAAAAVARKLGADVDGDGW